MGSSIDKWTEIVQKRDPKTIGEELAKKLMKGEVDMNEAIEELLERRKGFQKGGYKKKYPRRKLPISKDDDI